MGELKDLERNSVEETLNELLNHEVDELVNAQRNERSSNRQGYRFDHYDCIITISGDVIFHVPKLKGIPFETATIECYRQRYCSGREQITT
ncbi:MAG: transposase [Firmicutes bacterium]|nr:transposase [Bacillota bacterium]